MPTNALTLTAQTTRDHLARVACDIAADAVAGRLPTDEQKARLWDAEIDNEAAERDLRNGRAA